MPFVAFFSLLHRASLVVLPSNISMDPRQHQTSTGLMIDFGHGYGPSTHAANTQFHKKVVSNTEQYIYTGSIIINTVKTESAIEAERNPEWESICMCIASWGFFPSSSRDF
jgi:hypothetical protein